MRSCDPREPTVVMPRNVVVVMLDSLNRHMLGSYGGTEFDTPNLDGFARRATRFTRRIRSGAEQGLALARALRFNPQL